jgi:tellurite resistance protein TerC
VIRQGKKLVRLVVGAVLVIAGLALALPGIPGPGIAVVVLGLSILSVDFEFARRLLDRMKESARRVFKRRTPGATG